MRMALDLIGKAAPLPEELEKAERNGFKKIELYMKEEFLTDGHLKFLSDAKRKFGMEFYSIHTPHSEPKVFLETLRKTDEFAKKAGIPVIVVHSSFTNVFSDEVIGNLGKNMFVENGHRHNLPMLQEFFERGVRICFDTAHFYVAALSTGRDYYEDTETLLRDHGGSIGHLHIADSSDRFDGTEAPVSELLSCDESIGDGAIDFAKVMPVIEKYYDGVAVVEVKVDRQRADVDKLRKILSSKSEQEPHEEDRVAHV